MGLLKQNGDNGKVIRAQGTGKALKQNYNFGFGYKGSAGYSIDLNILDILNSLNEMTILFIQKTGGSQWKSFLTFRDETNAEVLDWESRYDGSFIRIPSVTNLYVKSPVTANNPCFQGVYFNSNRYRWYKNELSGEVNTTSFNGILNANISSAVLHEQVDSTLVHRMMIFNREISVVEWNYLYNNFLGNELLNSNGLVVDFIFNTPEILTINGVNKVGVRNFKADGSDMHGEILNLPAGTIDEQLAYASSNLFELW